jgi:hypothetical protein
VFIEKVETGSEDLEVETTKFQLEEIEDDVLARARDIRRWRETGEIALEQDFAVRLTVEGDEIIRNVAMPGGAPGVGQS